MSNVGFVRMGEAGKKPRARGAKKELGVGMLGYAFMGKAHSNAYIKMPIFFYPPPARPKLVAICGRTTASVRTAAERYGYSRYYTDWRKLVRDKEVQVVDNGLPNDMHMEPCIEAVELGKHILCEKPLGRNAAESWKMLRAAEKAGVKHMVAYNYRFIPAIRLMKKLIDEGYVGKVLQYRAVYLQEWIMDPNFPLVWRLRKAIAGSGAMGDLGSHVIDFARFLVGEVTSTSAITKTFIEERPLPDGAKGRVDVDDAFIALVKFNSGAIGSIEATRFAAGRKNYARVEVHGSEGSLSFDLERLNELQVYTNKDSPDRRGFKPILVTESIHPFGENWWPHGHVLGWEHAAVHEVYHFFDAVANDRSVGPWGATFNDGHRVDQIIDAMLKSARTGRWETTQG